jgi:hypothetical protein
MSTILLADSDNFVLHPSYEIPSYRECKFDKEAVMSSTNDEKCYKIVNASGCSLVNVKNLEDLQNIQEYIANISQKDSHTTRKIYRIKDVDKKLEINQHYLIFSRADTLRGQDQCMYINPYAKTVMLDSCNSSSASICEITPSTAKENKPTSFEETSNLSVKRFAIYFLSSVGGTFFGMLLLALLLFGPLLKYWRPKLKRCEEDTTPIYKVKYTRGSKDSIA